MTVSLLVEGGLYIGLAYAGAIAHEYTHALVARYYGLHTYVDPIGLELYTDDHSDMTWREDAVIGLAPLAVGLLCAVGFVASGRAIFEVPIPVLLGWGIYTLLGGSRDFASVAKRMRGAA